MLQKAHVAVDVATKRTVSNILRARAYVKLLVSRRWDDDTTLQMFYEWYYAPIFHACSSGHNTMELFEKTVVEKWSLELSKSGGFTSQLPVEEENFLGWTVPSSEYTTLANAAVQGDTLIWRLASLTGAVDCCLQYRRDTSHVLALVFSILSDPPILYGDPPMSIPKSVQTLLPMFQQRSSPEFVASRYRNCQYHPRSALGKRLQEDVRLWLMIVADSSQGRKTSQCDVDFGPEEIACTLLGLLQQSLPWAARTLPYHFDRLVILRNQCLWVCTGAKQAIQFLRKLQAIGVKIDFDGDSTKYHPACDHNPTIRLADTSQNPALRHELYMRTGSWWGGPEHEETLNRLSHKELDEAQAYRLSMELGSDE